MKKRIITVTVAAAVLLSLMTASNAASGTLFGLSAAACSCSKTTAT
jgi:hypothetical protein